MILFLQDFKARAAQLFLPVAMRMYVASVIGRLEMRSPFGARRSAILPARTPTLIAQNGSKARALLVYTQFFGGADVTLTSSPDAGTTNFVTAGNLVPDGIVHPFVLGPDDQLFGTANGLATVVIGTEWY